MEVSVNCLDDAWDQHISVGTYGVSSESSSSLSSSWSSSSSSSRSISVSLESWLVSENRSLLEFESMSESSSVSSESTEKLEERSDIAAGVGDGKDGGQSIEQRVERKAFMRRANVCPKVYRIVFYNSIMIDYFLFRY